MKIRVVNKGRQALTMLELLVVIVVIGIGMLILWPAFNVPGDHSRPQSIQIQCVSNLKQIGLAFHIWEADHNDFPMQVYTNELGAPLFTDSASAFHYFQVMSNELSNPKILICPADKGRSPATNFITDFNSSHLSYFIGLNANVIKPNSFLDGDSNLTNGTTFTGGLMAITTNQTVGCTKARHVYAGNVGLSDASVQQFSSEAVQRALGGTGLATNRLLMP